MFFSLFSQFFLHDPYVSSRILLVFEQRTAIDRSIGATFDFFREMYGAPAKVFSGPEKSRGVDFSRQTYSKRYDFFDSFRAARSMEASARRSISLREINGAPAKNSSGPENRDASILLGKHIANAMIFSTVFDRNRSRHREVAKWAGLGWLARHPRLIFIKEVHIILEVSNCIHFWY